MIAIRNVKKEFDVDKQKVTALSDVNFTIEKGDIFSNIIARFLQNICSRVFE